MNKVLIGFNVLLAAAVVYLFVQSPGNKTEEPKKNTTEVNAAFVGEKAKGDLRVAVVNIDSLNVKYDLFKDEAARLQKRTSEIRQELQTAKDKAMRRMQAIQSKDPNLMTNSEKQNAGFQLQKIEQEYMILENKRSVELDSLNAVISERGNESLKKFLQSFAAEKKIDFVLRDGYMSPILYGDTIYDITDVVAKALNEEYQKTKGTK